MELSVDGHIFLTSSSVYKIPSLISNDDLIYTHYYNDNVLYDIIITFYVGLPFDIIIIVIVCIYIK
jgi:hypothetical protein